MKLKLKTNCNKITTDFINIKKLKKNKTVNVIDKSSKNQTIFLNCYIKKLNKKNISASFIKFDKIFELNFFFNNLNLLIEKKQ
jgi:hypothetical protein